MIKKIGPGKQRVQTNKYFFICTKVLIKIYDNLNATPA